MMENIIYVPESLELSEKDTESLFLSVGEDDTDEVNEMISEAAECARPRVIYNVLQPEMIDGGIIIKGIKIFSPLMHDNFKTVHRVFPYICTCGPELEEWAKKYSADPLAKYWAEQIKGIYLTRVIMSFYEMIKDRYDIAGYFSQMNPGSIIDWPLSGQNELFAVLGRDEIKESIGVSLTDSMLMIPSKSVSGIGFESNAEYHNCSRCPMANCPNRRAEFDESLI